MSQENISKFVKNSNTDHDIKNYEYDIDQMDWILNNNQIPDINVQDPHSLNMTALSYRTNYGTLKSITWLLIHKANPNIRDNFGFTPLHWAVFQNDPDKVRLLLEYGADPTISNIYGLNPQEYARKLNRNLVMDILERFNADDVRIFVLNYGTDPDINFMNVKLTNGNVPGINTRDNVHRMTALISQAYSGTIEAMEWLLTRDPSIDINLQDKFGNTALMWATIQNNPEKVDLLLRYGAL